MGTLEGKNQVGILQSDKRNRVIDAYSVGLDLAIQAEQMSNFGLDLAIQAEQVSNDPF